MTNLLNLWPTLWRRFQILSDIDYYSRISKTAAELGALHEAGFNVARFWGRTAARHPTKECLVCDGVPWTFQQVDEASNRVARWTLTQV